MNYLIDIGGYDSHLVLLKEKSEVLEFLKEQNIRVVAYGENLVVENIGEVTMSFFAERKKPASVDLQPSIESATLDFEKWQNWKKTVAVNAISGGGWDSCESVHEHYRHLYASWVETDAEMKLWELTWGKYLDEK